MGTNNSKEELKKQHQLVGNLIHEIDYKNQLLSEMEHRYNETNATLRGLVDDLVGKINLKDSRLLDLETKYHDNLRRLKEDNVLLHHQFAEENRKLKSANIKLKHQLSDRNKELEDCKSRSDVEQKTLSNEMKALKKKSGCQNLAKLDNISSAQVDCHCLRKELEEKSEALQDLERDYKCLTVKQILTNQELQEARKQSISGLKDLLTNRTSLGIKRMGEVNRKAFEHACSLKFPNEDWQEISAKLCSSWDQNVQDPNWHPFKRILCRGNLQETIDEDDDKLKELRNEYGEAAFEAVSTALMEMNEYNASGRYAVSEIWNLKEERKASMKEIIEYVIKQLKSHKRKRKRPYI